MRKLFWLLFCFSLIRSVTAIETSPTPQASNPIEIIKSNLKTNLPDLKVEQVNPTAIPNLYEVVSGRKIFYVDSTGRYAILGNMVDLTNKQSITEARVKQLSVVDFRSLPLNIALKQTIGTGERKIAIFTDPDCPFCKRLETDTIPKLKNVTIYYFLFPLTSIHANAAIDSKKILCSENPDRAYLQWMTDSKALGNKTECANAKVLTQMQEVGKKVIQVEATPTIVLENGNIVAGLVPADYLGKLINDAHPPIKANNAAASVPAIKSPGK